MGAPFPCSIENQEMRDRLLSPSTTPTPTTQRRLPLPRVQLLCNRRHRGGHAGDVLRNQNGDNDRPQFTLSMHASRHPSSVGGGATTGFERSEQLRFSEIRLAARCTEPSAIESATPLNAT
jgi:hypothetical protein